MGRFLLGSTVVMLMTRDAALDFNPDWAPARGIRLGERMA
jgi:phosphatidylserine decarboxylase